MRLLFALFGYTILFLIAHAYYDAIMNFAGMLMLMSGVPLDVEGMFGAKMYINLFANAAIPAFIIGIILFPKRLTEIRWYHLVILALSFSVAYRVMEIAFMRFIISIMEKDAGAEALKLWEYSSFLIFSHGLVYSVPVFVGLFFAVALRKKRHQRFLEAISDASKS